MRILLVRIFFYYAFSLYLTYTSYRYLPKVVSEREKRKKKTMFGAKFSYFLF